ncbi:MAG: hypothetical protein ABJ205_06280 [Erythrobacter sp.]|uniref:hypothetical protein n=1 Tax=Erythrobacter sp. TaxID=1042 RepID=UPI003267F031
MIAHRYNQWCAFRSGPVAIRSMNQGYSHAELYRFFSASKIGCVTPLRDDNVGSHGRELILKERA